jgi:hypothetical protein
MSHVVFPAFLSAVCCMTILTLSDPARTDDAATPAGGQPNRFFELRTYHAAEGKLDALHARFRDHTNGLFKKHGMTIIAFWTPADEPTSKNTLIYVLAYPSREAREQAWKDFQADPEWQKAKADSEKDGKLVLKVDSVYMNPTDYSPVK